MTPDKKEERLQQIIGSYQKAIVAFSGGVDSSYLAYMAHRVLGQSARAVTAVSSSVSELQRRLAIDFARRHGLNHSLIQTHEMEDPSYTGNPADRCYFCKSELYSHLNRLRRKWGVDAVLDGSNSDDVRDYRPGRQAVAEERVVSPLIEAGLGKDEIRALSKKWGLSTWDLPAMPCLSSRFPYGVEITEEKLRQVERSEQFLRSLGLKNFRVRHHEDLARIELDAAEMARILNPEIFARVHKELRSYGYRYVTLDLGGFRSGSLNEGLVQLAASKEGRG